MVLIAFASLRPPAIAYRILVTLFSYTIVLIVGFFVSSGLLYVRCVRERSEWLATAGFRPWLGPTAAILYTLISAFLLIAPFVPPKPGSPFLSAIPWYIVPTVGLSALIVGFVYYLSLIYVVPPLFKDDKVLISDREAVIVTENEEYVMYMEIVDSRWVTRWDSDSDFDKPVARMRLEH